MALVRLGLPGWVLTAHHATSMPQQHELTPDVDEVGRDDEKDEAMLDPVNNDLSWELWGRKGRQ